MQKEADSPILQFKIERCNISNVYEDNFSLTPFLYTATLA